GQPVESTPLSPYRRGLAMLFKKVSIARLAHIDAPHTLTSEGIAARLKPTRDRLGIRVDVLGDIAGIHARRLWDDGMTASDVATMAARKALEDAGIGVEKIGLLVNTSVSRDYLEPSTASIVSGNLGVSRSEERRVGKRVALGGRQT